jgi:hypothetical protein
MFTVVVFTKAKSWNQPRYPPTDEWIKKMWFVYTMEYYSAIKNELCIHRKMSGTKIIMLS